jgi:uncharacterized protein with von Willebrand factor type A (vWA) domain
VALLQIPADLRHHPALGAGGGERQGAEQLFAVLATELPEEWLRQEFERLLSEEERALLQSLGGLDKLLETLNQRLSEQKERHAGGNKWVGTGGSSPFGHGGYHPEGIRMGGEGQHGRATKVWEARHFRNFSDDSPLGQRAIQLDAYPGDATAQQCAPAVANTAHKVSEKQEDG